MAQFKVDIEKQLGTEYWTNVYYVDATRLSDAVTAANAVILVELAVHNARVFFTKARVSEVGVPGSFSVIPINDNGLATGDADMLPLFNTVTVDLQPGTGRASKKYLRGLLREDVTLDFKLTDAYRASIADDYADALVAIPELRDEHGNAIVSATVEANIGMRQLRRGSRRRTTPILP